MNTRFDDDAKFRVCRADGSHVCDCETLTDAERVLESEKPGAYIAFPPQLASPNELLKRLERLERLVDVHTVEISMIRYELKYRQRKP